MMKNPNQMPKAQPSPLLFHYLYRDAGNYKEWSTMALACPADTAVEAATAAIEKLLIDQTIAIQKGAIP